MKLVYCISDMFGQISNLLSEIVNIHWLNNVWCNNFIHYVLTYLLSYLLTPWSRVLLEKLNDFQLVKKFPTFYGTRRFITAFTSVRHLSLSWASSIQSIPPTSHFLKIHLNIILPSTPGFPKWSFPSGFPCIRLFSPIRPTCLAHLILLDFITRKIFGGEYRSLSSTDH